MKNEVSNRAWEIFHSALEWSENTREQFVAEACGSDLSLKEEVDRLLSLYQENPSFMEDDAIEEKPPRDELECLKRALEANFEIERKIGSGGMGNLYLATHRELGGKWVIKVLSEDLTEIPSVVKRFKSEAKIEAKLQHPNIIKVSQIGESEEIHYFVMNYVEGCDLGEQLKVTGKMGENEALSIVLQITRALQCAHDNGIVHRDLKPANIRIDQYGTIVVLDFGIAKAKDAALKVTTARGQKMGTPSYMSPEQIRGEKVDHRSDFYSLGVVLYELATGSNPFVSKNRFETYKNHLELVPPRLNETYPELSDRMSDLVSKLLQKKPAERYQSAIEILAELEDLLGVARVTPNTVSEMELNEEISSEETVTLAPQIVDETELVESTPEPHPQEPVPLTDQSSEEDDPKVFKEPSPSKPVENDKRNIDFSSGRKPFRLVGIAALAVVIVGVLLWIILSGGDQGNVTLTASPWAEIQVLDSEGEVISEVQSPTLLDLSPGDYSIQFTNQSETERESIVVDDSGNQVIHKDFWTEEDIKTLIEQFLNQELPVSDQGGGSPESILRLTKIEDDSDASLREQFKEAVNLVTDRMWIQSLVILRRIKEKKPNFPGLERFISRAEKALSDSTVEESYRQARNLISQKEWVDARDILKIIQEQRPGYLETKELLDRVEKNIKQIETLEKEINSLVAQDDFATAHQNLVKLEELLDNEDVVQLKNQVGAELSKSKSALRKSLLVYYQGNYSTAAKELEKAQTIVRDRKTLAVSSFYLGVTFISRYRIDGNSRFLNKGKSQFEKVKNDYPGFKPVTGSVSPGILDIWNSN